MATRLYAMATLYEPAEYLVFCDSCGEEIDSEIIETRNGEYCEDCAKERGLIDVEEEEEYLD